MTNKFSNLSSRVLVAVAAIPLLLYASYLGGFPFMVMVMVIGAGALMEFYTLAKAKGADPQTVLGLAGLAAIHLSFFHEQLQNLIVPFFLEAGGISLLMKLQLFLTTFFIFVVMVVVVELFRNKGSIFMNAGATIFGVIYIGVFLGSLTGIRELFNAEFPYHLAIQFVGDAFISGNDSLGSVTYSWGGLTIIAIFISLWMCDTMAYFGGISLGRHKLFPRVSPNKSWEGALFGFAGAVASMVLFSFYFLPYVMLHQAVLMGVIIGVFGQIGDLIESLMKRDAGMKDSSTIIPGHGGMFDRFDSLILVSPILYLYIDFVILSY